MKIKWITLFIISLFFVGPLSAKSQSQVKKKDLTAEKIVEASRDPNNTGWVELNNPGLNSKRFFRYRDNMTTCHALIDTHVGAVALDCK